MSAGPSVAPSARGHVFLVCAPLTNPLPTRTKRATTDPVAVSVRQCCCCVVATRTKQKILGSGTLCRPGRTSTTPSPCHHLAETLVKIGPFSAPASLASLDTSTLHLRILDGIFGQPVADHATVKACVVRWVLHSSSEAPPPFLPFPGAFTSPLSLTCRGHWRRATEVSQLSTRQTCSLYSTSTSHISPLLRNAGQSLIIACMVEETAKRMARMFCSMPKSNHRRSVRLCECTRKHAELFVNLEPKSCKTRVQSVTGYLRKKQHTIDAINKRHRDRQSLLLSTSAGCPLILYSSLAIIAIGLGQPRSRKQRTKHKDRQRLTGTSRLT